MTGLRRLLTLIALVPALVSTVLLAGPAGAATTSTQTFTGTVDGTATFRTHSVTVQAPGTVTGTLDWTTTSADLQLQVKNPVGDLVARSYTTNRPETVTFEAPAAGTYKFGVKRKSGASAYTLTVTFPSNGVVAPTYLSTVGGPGHADIYPSGLDVDDATGTVYVADTGDDQIQAYAPDGTRLWVTGTRGNKALGTFDNPRDVAYFDGKVYVADTGYRRVQVLDAADGSPIEAWNHVFGTVMGISAGTDGTTPVILVSESSSSSVKVFSPTGTLRWTVGPATTTNELPMNDVRDAATDAAGKLYVADYKNNRIAVYGPGPSGSWDGVISSTGTDPGFLKRPYGVDVDAAGALYVADGNDRIQKFSTATRTMLWVYGSRGTGEDQFQMMRRVAVGGGSSPDVYGADLWTYRIVRFAQGGAYEATIGGTPPPLGFFNEAYGLAVDTELFVMDTTNQRAQRFAGTAPYNFQLAWGERGWGEGNPGFNWARDITTMSGPATVWVADTKNSRLLEFDRIGTPTGRVLGGFGAGDGQLNWPFALVATSTDLVVADTKNHRIVRWDPASPTPMWTATGFNDPKDVTVHGDVVYVADTDNKRIVRLRLSDGGLIDSFGTASLHRPEGVAVEPNGDIWVADTSWNRLVELSSTGTFLQAYGGLGSTHGKFNQPAHLEIAPGPVVRLFVADAWNDRIEVFEVART